MTTGGAQPRLRARLRTDLIAAMKAQNKLAVGALRSALAAIDNAEAVDASLAPRPDPGPIAGAVQGLHRGEVRRKELADADILNIVQAEIIERRAAAKEYAAHGRPDYAARLRVEADFLDQYLA